MKNDLILNNFILSFSEYFTKWKATEVSLLNESKLVFQTNTEKRHIIYSNNYAYNFTDFREIPKSKKKITIFNFADKVIDISNELNWKKQNPINILNYNRDTLFIGAGIQRLDWILKDTKSPKFEGGLVFQPVVRLNSLNLIDSSEFGFLSSFVNLCTVENDSSIEKHIQNIDKWVYVLSKLGLHSSNLLLRIDKEPWQLGNILGIRLHILYCNLEIGDAVLIYRTDNHTIVSDIGFGLERLFWAYAKDKDFSNLIFNKFSKHLSYTSIDAIRTVNLLLGQGVDINNHATRNKFKMLIKRIDYNKLIFGSEQICKYFYDFWSFYSTPSISLPLTNSIFNRELFYEK